MYCTTQYYNIYSRSGNGVYNWTDGSSYRGNWRLDMMSGLGESGVQQARSEGQRLKAKLNM